MALRDHFPARKGERMLLLGMLLVSSLIYLNYTMLRATKPAFVVWSAGDAMAIPLVRVVLVLPATLLLTWLLTRLMRRYSAKHVFVMTLLVFVGFFVAFVTLLYPFRTHFLVYGSFFAMCELWKVALGAMLFWSFLNRHLLVEEAKRFYGPVMLGASLGALLAGPVTYFCMSDAVYAKMPLCSDQWRHSLYLVVLMTCVTGGLMLLFFNGLARRLERRPSHKRPEPPKAYAKLGVLSSLKVLVNSPYLGTMALMIFGDYIAYSLGELLLFDTLHSYFPDPTTYTRHMSVIAFIGSATMLISATFVAPFLLQRFRWQVTALITPVGFAVTGGAFLIALLGQDTDWMISFAALFSTTPLWLAVLAGSAMFCVCRGTKLALLDSAKEVAYSALPDDLQVRGKLAVEGSVTRGGRAIASALTYGLVSGFGSVAAAVPYVSAFAVAGTALWVGGTRMLGRHVEAQTSAPATV